MICNFHPSITTPFLLLLPPLSFTATRITNAIYPKLTVITRLAVNPRHRIHHCATILTTAVAPPIRLNHHQIHTPQPWPLHAHQTAAIHSRRYPTVTTPYQTAPQAIQTIQFLQILPSHTESANYRHTSSPNMQSQIRRAQALRVSVALPTKTVTQTRLQLQ